MKEQWLKLITGLVDGELPAAERQLAEKLLRQSPEALELYRQLSSHRDRLRAMPAAKAPEQLARNVLAELRNRTAPRPATLPLWRRTSFQYLAAAASLLLVVSLLGLIFYLSPDQNRVADGTKPVNPAVASRAGEPIHPHRPEVAQVSMLALGRDFITGVAGAVQALAQGAGEQAVALAARQSEKAVAALLEQQALRETVVALGMATARPGQGLTTRDRKPTPPIFRHLQFELPPLLEGASLAADLPRLKAIVGKGGLYQLDLVSTDPAVMLDRLIAAGEQQKIRFIQDSDLKNGGKVKKDSVYQIYLENGSPRQLADLFDLVFSAENAAATSRTFVSGVLSPFDEGAARQLAADLGVPAASLASGAHGELTEPKDIPNPNLRTAPTKPSEGSPLSATAVVYLKTPSRSGRFASKELRSFLDHRPGPKAHRVTLLITLRPRR